MACLFLLLSLIASAQEAIPEGHEATEPLTEVVAEDTSRESDDSEEAEENKELEEPEKTEEEDDATTTPEEDAPTEGVAPIEGELTDEEVADTTMALKDAIESDNWPLAAALSVMLVVYIIRRLGLLKAVPKDAVPWISVVLGLVVCIATSIIAGNEVDRAIIDGLMVGLSGSGSWNTLGKHGQKMIPALAVPEHQSNTSPNKEEPAA